MVLCVLQQTGFKVAAILLNHTPSLRRGTIPHPVGIPVPAGTCDTDRVGRQPPAPPPTQLISLRHRCDHPDLAECMVFASMGESPLMPHRSEPGRQVETGAGVVPDARACLPVRLWRRLETSCRMGIAPFCLTSSSWVARRAVKYPTQPCHVHVELPDSLACSIEGRSVFVRTFAEGIGDQAQSHGSSDWPV